MRYTKLTSRFKDYAFIADAQVATPATAPFVESPRRTLQLTGDLHYRSFLPRVRLERGHTLFGPSLA
jgi:hypothetical protein